MNNRKSLAWFGLGLAVFALVAFTLNSLHLNTNQFGSSGNNAAWIKPGAMLTNINARGFTNHLTTRLIGDVTAENDITAQGNITSEGEITANTDLTSLGGLSVSGLSTLAGVSSSGSITGLAFVASGGAPGKFSPGTNGQFATFGVSDNGAFAVIQTNVVVSSTNGYTGIGTNAPIAQLHVHGTNLAWAYSFGQEYDATPTQIERPAAAAIAIKLNGSEKVRFTGNTMLFQQGDGLAAVVQGASAGASVTLEATAQGSDAIIRSGSTGTKDVVLSVNNTDTTHKALWAGTAKTLTESTATTIANIAVAASKFIGAQLYCTVNAGDGTDFQSISSRVSIDAVNKAGTLTIGALTQTDNTAALSSGTLTVTYTAVANGNSVDIKADAVSSLTQTTLACTIAVTALNSDGVSTITRP